MRDNITTYKIWAPNDVLWTEWVKPVLFANMPKERFEKIDIPTLSWITQADYTTAIIVDLPGKEGVLEGLALARLGYRPVLLYNGVYGSNTASMIVPVKEIANALCKGTDELATMNLRPDAPPAFLLDSNRMRGFGKQPGKYDNRWCVFPQDMPSASFLLDKGIRSIIVRTNERQNDLSHILYRYEAQGIAIYLNNGDTQKRVTVTKPSRFKSLFYRFSVILGLKRNAAGGFGGQIPDPVQGGSGGRYYGIG